MKLKPLLFMLAATPTGCRIARICTGFLSSLAFVILLSMSISWWADLKLAFLTKSVGYANLSNDFLAIIPEAHFFGIQAPASILNFPLTTSVLKLTGLIQTNQAEVSIAKAIIAVNNEPGKVYQEGDILPGGIKLAAISQEGALLDNKGHWERLSLSRLKLERK